MKKKIGTCAWCGQRRNRCICRHMPFIISPHIVWPKGPYSVVKSKRAVGLEFELSKWGDLWEDITDFYSTLLHDLHMNTHFDSSVYPSEHELVVGPVAGDAILEYIPRLMDVFSKNDVEVNNTCSFHVHVDARDVYTWGIRSFLLLYEKWEKTFNHLFPVRRIFPTKSSGLKAFAKPLAPRAKLAIQRMEAATTTQSIKKLLAYSTYNIMNLSNNGSTYLKRKSTRYESSRYHGCNIHSYLSRGTIEFRQHEGVTGSEALLYPIFCTTFVDLIAKPEAWSKFKELTLQEFVHQNMNKTMQSWFDQRISKFAGGWTRRENKIARAAITRAAIA